MMEVRSPRRLELDRERRVIRTTGMRGRPVTVRLTGFGWSVSVDGASVELSGVHRISLLHLLDTNDQDDELTGMLDALEALKKDVGVPIGLERQQT